MAAVSTSGGGVQSPVTDNGVANVGVGSTALLIVVGVAVDTMRQLESQLMMRNYEGYLGR